MKALVLSLLVLVASYSSVYAESEISRDSPSISLTPREKKIWVDGRISAGSIAVGSGLIYLWPLTLGIPHALVGYWPEKGWIFTLTEGVSVGAVVYGVQNKNAGAIIGGVVGFAVARVWEIIDFSITATQHNSTYDDVERRIENQKVDQKKRGSLDLIPKMMPVFDRRASETRLGLNLVWSWN